jgi:hypothetical protein
MTKRPKKLRNPDDTPDIGALQPIRRLIGGETPAEQADRVEREQRDRPIDILGRRRRPKR